MDITQPLLEVVSLHPYPRCMTASEFRFVVCKAQGVKARRYTSEYREMGGRIRHVWKAWY